MQKTTLSQLMASLQDVSRPQALAVLMHLVVRRVIDADVIGYGEGGQEVYRRALKDGPPPGRIAGQEDWDGWDVELRPHLDVPDSAMDVMGVLYECQAMYARSRGQGHTKALLDAVKANPEMIVVLATADPAQCREVKRAGGRPISLHGLKNTRGCQRPIGWDNFAIHTLVNECALEMERLAVAKSKTEIKLIEAERERDALQEALEASQDTVEELSQLLNEARASQH